MSATPPAPPIFETIAAIATAPGPAGVGIVRVSGPCAVVVARRLLPRSHRLPHRKLVHAQLVHPLERRPLDAGFVCAMYGPHSFTGEDVVELQVHGGARNLERVLGAVLAAGARLAEPGEFTRRAVLNGRMDLTQAEALLDIVAARTDAALALAQEHRRGAVSAAVAALAQRLEALLVRVEADLDFPDEEGTGLLPQALRGDVCALAADTAALAGTFAAGRILRDGFRVAILGAPNAGKSTLFNALLGEERAIVTAAPGTTRDFIEETVELAGLPFVLIDTAGLRGARGRAERAGVERSWAQAAAADLVMLVHDAGRAFGTADRRLLARLDPARTLLVFAKSDRPRHARPAQLPPAFQATPVSVVCALSGAGLPALRETLRARALPADGAGPGAVIVSRLRHQQALLRSVEALRRAAAALEAAAPLELAAADLHAARRALGELVGECTPDDVLRQIFERFCVGK